MSSIAIGSDMVLAATSPLPNQAVTGVSTPTVPRQLTAVVNINSVDVTTLQKIKGMSKKKAQAIVDYRKQNGPFKSLEDLLKVNCRGIHKNWLEKVSKFLTL